MSSSPPGLRYPRSFLALLVTGFLLVALPLAAALLWSAWNTGRLAEAHRERRVARARMNGRNERCARFGRTGLG